MTGPLVSVAAYLTHPEATELYRALEAAEVVALVKNCGPARFPFGEGVYYELLVQEDALPLAQPVFDLFSEKQAKNRNQQLCPSCGCAEVEPEGNLNWWKKVLYAGTTVYVCTGCGHSFFA